MKVLITESQYNLLLETSKKEILINKLGFTEGNANAFDAVCGSLAIWMAKKIIKSYAESAYPDLYMTNLTIKNNFTPGHATYENLVNIMDFIRTGLNGNVSTIQNLNYWKLTEKSNEWHKSLQKGTSKIDYDERNDIIIDYRSGKGLGFYWVSLGKKYCDDESKRMGHCGRSSGFLYSLRKYTPTSGNHTLNDSILTASINTDGELLQLKGAMNSKPTEDFHPYILDLLNFKENGRYLIDKIGYEYDSSNDFKISDLDDEEFIRLYKNRPTLFNGFSSKRRLVKLGLSQDDKTISETFVMVIKPNEIINYLGYNHDIAMVRLNNGIVSIYEYICENILDKPLWNHLFVNETDMESYVNEHNIKLINDILIKNGISEKYVNDTTKSMNGKVYLTTEGTEIVKAIYKSFKQTVGQPFMHHLRNELVKAMDVFGKVRKMDKNGMEIIIDLTSLLENYDDYQNVLEKCDTNLCVFDEITQFDQYDEKPSYQLNLDDFNETIINSQFNQVLTNYLEAITIS